MSLKVQVLGVGELEKGARESGGEWKRKVLQIWTGQIAGNHPFYHDDDKVLDGLKVGEYMCDVEPRAGNRGRLEFQIANLTPVVQAKANANA